MLIKCPECDSEVSDNAAACPKCGFPLKHEGREEVANPTVKTQPSPVCLAISFVALVLSLFTPRFLVFMPLLMAAALAVLSLIRREKWRWAGILVLISCVGVLAL